MLDITRIQNYMPIKIPKSNLYYSRGIMPKREKSVEPISPV